MLFFPCQEVPFNATSRLNSFGMVASGNKLKGLRGPLNVFFLESMIFELQATNNVKFEKIIIKFNIAIKIYFINYIF
jgi:hypothetical protein